MGGWKDGDEDVPDELWRTLVADRGLNGTTAPRYDRRAYVIFLQLTNRGGDLNIAYLKGDGNCQLIR
jgi:hypothetical protein